MARIEWERLAKDPTIDILFARCAFPEGRHASEKARDNPGQGKEEAAMQDKAELTGDTPQEQDEGTFDRLRLILGDEGIKPLSSWGWEASAPTARWPLRAAAWGTSCCSTATA